MYFWLYLTQSLRDNKREVTQEILNRILGSILGILGSGLVSIMHVGEKCLATGESGPLELESVEPPGVGNCGGSDSTVRARTRQ